MTLGHMGWHASLSLVTGHVVGDTAWTEPIELANRRALPVVSLQQESADLY